MCTSQHKIQVGRHQLCNRANLTASTSLFQSYLKAQSHFKNFAACSVHCMKNFITTVVGYSPGSTTASLLKPPTQIWFFALIEDTGPGSLLLKVNTTPLS